MASGGESLRGLFTSAYSNQPIQSIYCQHKREKRREYGQKIGDINHSHFTPLNFTTTEGMGDLTTQLYKRFVNLLSAKHGLLSSVVMGWISCKLTFYLSCCAIMCICSACSSFHCPVAQAPITVQVTETYI